MSGEVLAILLSLVTYILSVLLPIVPALTIYKNAPGSTVAVTGPLSKLSIRATGAIGAYIIFFVLGEVVILNVLNKIDTIPQPTMNVQARVELVDPDGRQVNDPTALSTLQVYISPDLYSVNGSFAVIKIPGSIGERWPHPFITFMADDYINKTIDLCKFIRGDRVRFERSENFLELLDPVQLTRKREDSYASGEHLAPAAATGPPVKIEELP